MYLFLGFCRRLGCFVEVFLLLDEKILKGGVRVDGTLFLEMLGKRI